MEGHTLTNHDYLGHDSAETESEKIGGGARILKYERSRRARPPSAASPIGCAMPDCSSSGHLTVADWLQYDAFCRFALLIGPWAPQADTRIFQYFIRGFFFFFFLKGFRMVSILLFLVTSQLALDNTYEYMLKSVVYCHSAYPLKYGPIICQERFQHTEYSVQSTYPR